MSFLTTTAVQILGFHQNTMQRVEQNYKIVIVQRKATKGKRLEIQNPRKIRNVMIHQNLI